MQPSPFLALLDNNPLHCSSTFVALESATGRCHPVGSHPCQGIYYTPAGVPRPRVAIIATHYSADLSEHYLGPRMAALGIGFLGWNTRFRGAEDTFALEHALIDIAAGVRWLRELQGVETLVLLGNSGGGSLMAAYQSQAANPVLAPRRPGPWPEAVAALPKGDLYISLNAHGGRPEYLTAIIDPSVIDEFDPVATDPALDMYNEANGPPYSAEFVLRYRAAQEARNHRITDWALTELERLQARGHSDRIFTVNRVWADLRFMDPSLDPSNRIPRTCYGGDPRQTNRGAIGMARAMTLNTWLSLFSLKHSPCRAALHLPHVTVPSLVIQGLQDVGVFPGDARLIHEGLGARDKRLEFMPGTHFLDSPPGAADAVAAVMADWIRVQAGSL